MEKVHKTRTESTNFTAIRCVFHVFVLKLKRCLTVSAITGNSSRNIIKDIIDLLNEAFSTLSLEVVKRF